MKGATTRRTNCRRVIRILELEKGKTNVEIWDVSGDQACVYRAMLCYVNRMPLYADTVWVVSYEACWAAVTKDVNGVILVYNPESHIHESEAMLWYGLYKINIPGQYLIIIAPYQLLLTCPLYASRYEWFIQNPAVDPSVCLVFEHASGSSANNNNSNGNKKQSQPNLGSKLRLPGGIRVAQTTFDSPNVLKSEFEKLLQTAQDAAARQAPRGGARK